MLLPAAATPTAPVHCNTRDRHTSTAVPAGHRHRQCQPLGAVLHMQQHGLHAARPVQPAAVQHQQSARTASGYQLRGWPGQQHSGERCGQPAGKQQQQQQRFCARCRVHPDAGHGIADGCGKQLQQHAAALGWDTGERDTVSQQHTARTHTCMCQSRVMLHPMLYPMCQHMQHHVNLAAVRQCRV